MKKRDEYLDEIKAFSSKKIPYVLMGVQWVAEDPPDYFQWFIDCHDDCVQFAAGILGEGGTDNNVYIEPPCPTVKIRDFGFVQLAHIGNKSTFKMLEILFRFGFSAYTLFYPYTDDKDLLTTVRYSYRENRKNSAVRVVRCRDINGKINTKTGYVRGFESRPYHDRK